MTWTSTLKYVWLFGVRKTAPNVKEFKIWKILNYFFNYFQIFKTKKKRDAGELWGSHPRSGTQEVRMWFTPRLGVYETAICSENVALSQNWSDHVTHLKPKSHQENPHETFIDCESVNRSELQLGVASRLLTDARHAFSHLNTSAIQKMQTQRMTFNKIV